MLARTIDQMEEKSFFLLVEIIVVVALSLRAPVNTMVDVTW